MKLLLQIRIHNKSKNKLTNDEQIFLLLGLDEFID
jgi:hypothetical protein